MRTGSPYHHRGLGFRRLDRLIARTMVDEPATLSHDVRSSGIAVSRNGLVIFATGAHEALQIQEIIATADPCYNVFSTCP